MAYPLFKDLPETPRRYLIVILPEGPSYPENFDNIVGYAHAREEAYALIPKENRIPGRLYSIIDLWRVVPHGFKNGEVY